MKSLLSLAGVAAIALPACGATAPPDTAPSTSSSPDSHAAGTDVLAVALGTEVRLIALDGSTTTLLAGEPFFADVTGVDLVGASSFVLVRAYADHGLPGELRFAMIGSDASVKWTQRFAVSFAGGTSESRGALSWSPRVSADDASVLVTDPTIGLRALGAGGVAGELTGYGPIGEVVGGYVPVATNWDAATPYTKTYGWWKLGPGRQLESTQTLTTAADDQGTSPTSLGHKIVRLERRGSSSVLVVQARDATKTISLPRTTASASIVSPSNDEMFGEDRWLLVAAGVPGRTVRVDVASGTADTVDLVPPPGYRPFDACREDVALGSELRIDRDGRIYGIFRNDDRVAAFTTVDGAQWTQLGGSFSGVGGLEVSSTRGTYTLRAHEAVYCFGKGPSWASPSGADFTGDQIQIVRPSAGTQLTLPGTSFADRKKNAGYTLSRTGRYGAHWLVEAGVATLRVTDLENGSERVVATQSGGVRSARPAWLWKP